MSLTGSGHDRPIEPSRRRNRRGVERYFFVAFSLAFLAVATLGFGPHVLAFVAGTFPIAAVAHFHGALMVSWLLLLVTQSVLATRGRMDLHRRVGGMAKWLGAAIWLSIVGLTIRGFMDHRYPLNENIYYSLPQFYVIVVFGLLFPAALMLRTNPPWHKRLMVIATMSLLQAAVDRFSWLPEQGPGYWPQVACLDVLMVMLVAFDLITIKRVHRATLVGGGVLFACQSAVALVWPTPWWHDTSVWLARALGGMH